ncbi:cytochrome c oxidase subunit 6a, mitochondrial [Daucus carota subsp. sativus]
MSLRLENRPTNNQKKQEKQRDREMASAIVRSALRNVQLRRSPASSARTFSSSKGVDDAHESAKWEKITYAGITGCTIYACYVLSKGHAHFEEPPPYSYLHIRSKEFPWGPDGLFEVKHH